MVLAMVAGVGRQKFEATAAVLYAPSRVKGTGNRRMQLRSVWRVSADGDTCTGARNKRMFRAQVCTVRGELCISNCQGSRVPRRA